MSVVAHHYDAPSAQIFSRVHFSEKRHIAQFRQVALSYTASDRGRELRVT